MSDSDVRRKLPLKTRVAAGAGLAAAGLSKALGKGEGSVIGGRVSLALDSKSLDRLAVGRRLALVTGTNGKTTTTSMLVAALETSGEVVTNSAGSNMFGGMVGALAKSDATVGVLEVDEAHVPKTLESTHAQFVVLLNLSRDQLDRVGEVRMQAQRWRESFEKCPVIAVANADDPMVVWAAQTARSVVWVSGGNAWKLDSASCPACGSKVDWDGPEWSCSECELSRPDPHARLRFPSHESSHPSLDGELAAPLKLKLPGDANLGNAAIALTTALLMGAEWNAAVEAVSNLEGTGGRYQSTFIAGRPVRLVLAKNPAGWTEALRLAKPAPLPLVVAINARVQDGRDPSWLWDVPYETLVGRNVVATGDRGRDLAVRLRYAGVDHEFVEDLRDAVVHATATARGNEIDIIGNYSAFQDFRKLAE